MFTGRFFGYTLHSLAFAVLLLKTTAVVRAWSRQDQTNRLMRPCCDPMQPARPFKKTLRQAGNT